MIVASGLDLLVEERFARLKGRRVGLLAHPASVDRSLRHVLPLMHAAGVQVEVVLGPEHGILGDAQDMEPVSSEGRAALPGARVYSLYGDEEASLRPTPQMLEGLDVVVVDLQDVGARYYTFAATMGYLLEMASVEVMVLDRPNPLGGRTIEGPPVSDGFRSFVGAYDFPIRHGLTMGEYARALVDRLGLGVELTVVPMRGWSREMDFDATGLPWVLPSPNMPTVETAWIYPGQCLLEGTNWSEGRGTTRPFELFGAPGVDASAFCAALSPTPGLALRPCYFTPQFQKHAGRLCGGAQIHIQDRAAVRSVAATVAFLCAARTFDHAFDWRRERYEYVTDRLAIDLLFGGPGPRELIEAGAQADAIVEGFRPHELAFEGERGDWLLY